MGCRLQTCRWLAPQWFDSTFRAFFFFFFLSHYFILHFNYKSVLLFNCAFLHSKYFFVKLPNVHISVLAHRGSISQPASSSTGQSSNCQCPSPCKSCWREKRKEGRVGEEKREEGRVGRGGMDRRTKGKEGKAEEGISHNQGHESQLF